MKKMVGTSKRDAARATLAAGKLTNSSAHAGIRMALQGGLVAHQYAPGAFVLFKPANSRCPSHAMHGTAMALPMAL